jgi:hypothetical protein
MNPIFNCGNCRFFNPTGGSMPNGNGAGECRRHQPQTVHSPAEDRLNRRKFLQGFSYWPAADSAQWCGDHEPEQRPIVTHQAAAVAVRQEQ